MIVGITAENCGRLCGKACAISATLAVNADAECNRLGVRAVLGDIGPWELSSAQREAVESAMDGADHACDVASMRAALLAHG